MIPKNNRLFKIFILIVGGIIIFASLFYLFFFSAAPHCRKWYGKPKEKTGAVFEGNYDNDILYMSIISSRFCLISIDDQKDPVFPDTSLRLKIGFFDRWWRLHSYNARIGGELSNGQIVKIPICIIQNNGQQKCSLYSVDQTKEMLKGKNFIKADLIYNDTAPWKNAEQIKKYQDFYIKLKNALLDNKDYPKIPDKNGGPLIQIWQIEI